MATNPSAPSGKPPGQPSAEKLSGSGSDPSMEDILASIRRILSEDDAGKTGGDATPATPGGDADVLNLDASMMVPETSEMPEKPTQPIAERSPMPEASAPEQPAPSREPPAPEAAAPPPAEADRPAHSADPAPAKAPAAGLIAPEAASAAASAMEPLLRRLNAERGTAIYRGGPTLEEMVREELRPLLKQWLDAHLPAIVERLVRAEIERVVGDAAS